jgi:hypothetical protein
MPSRKYLWAKKQANINYSREATRNLGISFNGTRSQFYVLPDTRLIFDLTRLDFAFHSTVLTWCFPSTMVDSLALPLAFPGRVPAVRCFPRSLSARHPRSTSDLPPSKFTPTVRNPGPPTFLPPHQRRARTDTRGLLCARAITLLATPNGTRHVRTRLRSRSTSHLRSRSAGRRYKAAEQATEEGEGEEQEMEQERQERQEREEERGMVFSGPPRPRFRSRGARRTRPRTGHGREGALRLRTGGGRGQPRGRRRRRRKRSAQRRSAARSSGHRRALGAVAGDFRVTVGLLGSRGGRSSRGALGDGGTAGVRRGGR